MIDLAQVSIVRVEDEECRDCPEDCKQYTWNIHLGGLLIASAFSAAGVVNFMNDYIPQFEDSIRQAKEAIVAADEIKRKLLILKADMEQRAADEDQQAPEAGSFN